MPNTHKNLVTLFSQDRFYFHGGTFIDLDEVADEVYTMLLDAYKSGYGEGYRDAVNSIAEG